LPGGRQVASPDHHAKRGSGKQTSASRRPIYATGLFGSAVFTSAAVSATVIDPTLPRWLAVLAILLSAVGSVVVGAIAAVMPQESKDRLTWWREWLRHSERMTGVAGAAPPSGSKAVVEVQPLPTSSSPLGTVASGTTPSPQITHLSTAPAATVELVPD